MQHLEVGGAVRPIYGSLGVKRLSMGKAKSHTAPRIMQLLFNTQQRAMPGSATSGMHADQRRGADVKI